MKLLVGPFYAFFILGVLFASFFVVFHLSNYSVNRRIAHLTMVIFLVGTAVLLITNVALFFSVPFDTLGSFNSLLPSSSFPNNGSSF